MRTMRLKQQHAFTLVEILIVMALMGIVVIAVMGLEKSSHRTSKTSEEIADVQQNLRIAMSHLSRDLRLAGFLVPAGQTALASAPSSLCNDLNADGDCLDSGESQSLGIRTAMARGRVARIVSDKEIPSGVAPETPFAFSVATSSMCDLFTKGGDSTGDYVTIIRPVDKQPPLDRIFRVVDKDRDAPTLTLREFNAPCQFRAGDLIVWVGSPGTYNDTDYNPNTGPPTYDYSTTVSFSLADDANSSDPYMKVLQRNDGLSGNHTVAGKLRNVAFAYLREDGSTTGNLDEIVAVRVLITGATDASMTGQKNYSGIKTRQLEQVVKLRN